MRTRARSGMKAVAVRPKRHRIPVEERDAPALLATDGVSVFIGVPGRKHRVEAGGESA